MGDGTPQAFIPILTGSTEEELPLTRYEHCNPLYEITLVNVNKMKNDFRKRFKTAKFVDEVYPFAWKNFSDNGYITGYGEDAANIGEMSKYYEYVDGSVHFLSAIAKNIVCFVHSLCELVE